MYLNFLTSKDSLNIISDFQYLYDLAKCSKCQIFVLLKSTNKLYGTSDDCATIHEIDVPFLVNTDLEFAFNKDDKDIIANNESYFIPYDYPYVILPAYYWDMYRGGDIIQVYNYETEVFDLYDKTTNHRIDQIHMHKYRVYKDYARNCFISQLDGFLRRVNFLTPPVVFTDMQNDPGIRKAYDSKSAMGRFLCRFTNGGVDVAVYFFKGLFSLAKSDTLELDVRFDVFNTNQFMITYRPIKKKNPITFNKYGVPFRERIHCMYINLI